ncbi:MAG: rhodanese-like domain-containing protein [Rhodospirillaceae bacterium]
MRKILSGLLTLVVGAFSFHATAADGLIAADEAYAAAKRGELLIIDVRTPSEWRDTGIPEGAKTADFNSPLGLKAFIDAVTEAVASDKARPIAVICRSGNRSTRAKIALEANGFTHVLNIREGMSGSGAGPGWLGRSLPVAPCRTC